MGITVRFHKGAWWLFIRHHNKRKAKKVGTKEAALRLKKELMERMTRSDLQLPVLLKSAPLKAYATAWLKTAEATLKASTVRFYTDNLENHIYPILGATPIHQVARADVRRLLAGMALKKVGHRTVTGVVRTLSTLLSEAVEDGHLQANPALRPGRLNRQLRNPNAPKKPKVDPYSREEVDLLVATAEKHYPAWHPFLLCAVRTGMRLGELRALQWGDFDWRERFIRVSRNFVEGTFTTTKSGHERSVDLSLQLRAALRLWRRRQRAAWLAKGEPMPDLVFPGPTGKPLDDSKLRKVVAAIVKKAEVRQRRRIVHVFRHTFGSLLIQQGESLTYVKEQMGHASIAVTVDVYGHLIPGGNRAAVDRLDSVPTNVVDIGRKRA